MRVYCRYTAAVPHHIVLSISGHRSIATSEIGQNYSNLSQFCFKGWQATEHGIKDRINCNTRQLSLAPEAECPITVCSREVLDPPLLDSFRVFRP